jgi:hypothetical protein
MFFKKFQLLNSLSLPSFVPKHFYSAVVEVPISFSLFSFVPKHFYSAVVEVPISFSLFSFVLKRSKTLAYMYSTYRWSSQLADRPSVVYFITLSFFLLTLKVSPKAFSQPHSAITCYYYYYFLHFAWESTFCKKDFADTRMSILKHWHIYTYFTYRWSFTTCR